VTAARAEYLIALAMTCHVPPSQVDRMTVADFGRLTLGIDALEERNGG
jgi:hypothetical protein